MYTILDLVDLGVDCGGFGEFGEIKAYSVEDDCTRKPMGRYYLN